MSIGSLAIVEAWQAAVNAADGPCQELSADRTEVLGPRGTAIVASHFRVDDGLVGPSAGTTP